MTKFTERFLVINARYVPDEKFFWMIIADYVWWNKNEYDILCWSKECLELINVEGMMIKFKTDEDRNLFIMRWANE